MEKTYICQDLVFTLFYSETRPLNTNISDERKKEE